MQYLTREAERRTLIGNAWKREAALSRSINILQQIGQSRQIPKVRNLFFFF